MEIAAALLTGLALQNSALLGLAGVALAHRHFPTPTRTDRFSLWRACWFSPWSPWRSTRARRRAIKDPIPSLIQKTIKTSLLALVWLHVGVIAGVRGLEPAAMVAVLSVPAYLLGRWLYTT